MKSLALYNTLNFKYLQRKIALQISFGQQILGPFSLHDLIFKILVFCFSQSHNTNLYFKKFAVWVKNSVL